MPDFLQMINATCQINASMNKRINASMYMHQLNIVLPDFLQMINATCQINASMNKRINASMSFATL